VAHRRRRHGDATGIRPAVVGQVAGSTFTQRRRFGGFPARGKGSPNASRHREVPGGDSFARRRPGIANRATADGGLGARSGGGAAQGSAAREETGAARRG
jgi:hypothetical protein